MGSPGNVYALIYYLSQSLPIPRQGSNRGIIRGRYKIDGGICGDYCAACWCTPCELTQESREIELEERSLAA